MEHMAAPAANLSHISATMSIVCLAISSDIRAAKRRDSSARWRQNRGSLMSMERASLTSMERAPLGPYTQLRKRHVVQNVIQSRCNVGTNTAININVTDNTATKTAASESSKPNGRHRIGANRHQRARGGSLNEQAWGRLVISRLSFVIRRRVAWAAKDGQKKRPPPRGATVASNPGDCRRP